MILYVVLINFILHYWDNPDADNQSEFDPVSNHRLQTKYSYSILVAARNEEDHIGHLMTQLLNNRYFEDYIDKLVVVDDFSTDNTLTLLKEFKPIQLKIVHMRDCVDNEQLSGKKRALNEGLKSIDSDYVIQLDADVSMDEWYIQAVVGYIERSGLDFVSMPVKIESGGGLLQDFQALDFTGMMALTMTGIQTGKWHMANGANMAYKRKCLDAFAIERASGDDAYAVQTIYNKGGKCGFLKSPNAVVSTNAMPRFTDLFHQRIRWATKNGNMSSASMKLMMLIPYINALAIGGLWSVGVISADKWLIGAAMNLSLIYLAIDYFFLRETTRFFDQSHAMTNYIPAKIFHWLYIILVGTLSFVWREYKWKGRKVK